MLTSVYIVNLILGCLEIRLEKNRLASSLELKTEKYRQHIVYNKYNRVPPSYYTRYVDDIFWVFNSNDVVVISLIQNLIKHFSTNFHILESIQSKLRKSCQKSVNSFAKILILKLFLLYLKLITISQLKIKHPIFEVFSSL